MQWENWVSRYKSLKRDPYLTPYTKINSNWIKELNIRFETIKLLEESTMETLQDTGTSNDFLDKAPKAQAIKEKIDKGHYIKQRSFCTANKVKNIVMR